MTTGKENVTPIDVMTFHAELDPVVKYAGGLLFGGPTDLSDATESAR